MLTALAFAVVTPFSDMLNVRDVAWSRDGKRLAILVAREAALPSGYPATTLHVWHSNTDDTGSHLVDFWHGGSSGASAMATGRVRDVP